MRDLAKANDRTERGSAPLFCRVQFVKRAAIGVAEPMVLLEAGLQVQRRFSFVGETGDAKATLNEEPGAEVITLARRHVSEGDW